MLALALLITVGASARSLADTAVVRAVVTKAGLIVGLGGGRGTLIFHGQSYPLIFSGISLGATIGISTANLKGHAYNLHSPSELTARSARE